MRIKTFDFRVPRRVKITSKSKWLRWLVKKKNHCVLVAGGVIHSGCFTNEDLSKISISGISIINPSRLADLFLLED